MDINTVHHVLNISEERPFSESNLCSNQSRKYQKINHQKLAPVIELS